MFFRSLRHDRADRGATDPILVIAAIAVSLVLLVGGSFAVAGMLGNAKDANAKNDLASIATAETAAQSEGNPFLAWSITTAGVIAGTKNLDGNTLDKGQIGFTTTPGVAINVNANSNGWVAAATASTGTKFFRSSKQAKIFIGSIPASAYDAGLSDPSTATPYNATAECPAPDSTKYGYLGDSQYSALNPTITGNTLTVTVTTTGTNLCSWAKVGNLNLAGDSVASAPSSEASGVLDVRIGDDSGGVRSVTVQSLRMSIVASGTALSANRTVTITASLANLSPYTSGTDLYNHLMDTGAFITIVPANGTFLSFSHEGPNMAY